MQMQEKSSFFIIDRYKKMSYITGYIPVEYGAKDIISDMKKAGIEEAITEDEINAFLEKSRNTSYEKILGKIKEGHSVFDIMQWCRLSTDCVIPICSLQCSVSGADDVAYGYFNFEVKRIIENELERILRGFRKEHGPEYNIADILSVLDKDNLFRVSMEMGMDIHEDKVRTIISDFEKNSILLITDYVLKSWSEAEVMEKIENDTNIVFGHSELLDIIPDIMRKERFRIIGKTVVGMKNNEVLAFIGAVEKMRLLKMIRSDTGLGGGPENGSENYSSEYMTHTAALSQDDLSVLIETLRAYMNWRSLLSFVRPLQTIPGKLELADSIIDGFSESNGINGELFRTFVVNDN
jgi:hypothetical protein